jgi:RNA polymerase sigma-70 factor (ECF subfamily)
MNGPSDHRPVSAELLGRLLDEHGSALALYAAQWTDAADDCVQDALVELAGQRVLPENAVAWLYRVVKNRALNAARGERRRRKRETRVAERRLKAVNSKSFDRWDAETVSEAIERLTENQREVVVMRIWGGLTFDQISTALSMSVSTAHRIYHQALRELHKQLESPCSTSTNTNSGNTTGPNCPPTSPR